MQQLLFWAAFVVVMGFAIAMKIIFNVSSISESWYHLERWRAGAGRYFQAWCIAPAFMLFPTWVDLMPEKWQFIPFLAVVALGAVGCVPRFLGRDKLAHYISAGLCAVFSILGCALCGMWYMPLITLIPAAAWIIATKRIDDIYWGEIAALVCVFVTVFIKIV